MAVVFKDVTCTNNSIQARTLSETTRLHTVHLLGKYTRWPFIVSTAAPPTFTSDTSV